MVILAGLVGLDHPLRSQHLRELLPAAPNQRTVLRGTHRIYRVLPQHHSPAFSMGDILGIKQQCSIDNVVFPDCLEKWNLNIQTSAFTAGKYVYLSNNDSPARFGYIYTVPLRGR